jgi:hypothetical protein
MAIAIYAARRGFVDLVASLSIPDLQVSYGLPGETANSAVSLGPGRFTRTNTVEEWGILQEDDANFDVVIQVHRSDDDLRAVESDVETIAESIIGAIQANPSIAAGITFASVTQGDVTTDYSPNPDPSIMSRLTLRVRVIGWPA